MNSTERELWSGFVLLMVILVIVCIYVAFRVLNQVVSVLAGYPHASRPLWIALGVFACLSVTAVVSQSATLAACSVAAGVVVLLVSRWIELANSGTFQEQATFASLQDDALHAPWWESNDERRLRRSAA
ncbi:MAG: hypothetical protein AB7F89_06750 [Pirellulaceae bacterium]